MMTRRQRAYLYRVALAVGTVLLVLGIITDSELSALVGLVTALLGNGVAAGHTPTRPKRLDGPERP